MGVQLRSHGCDQGAVLGVDRADAAERRVVVGHLLEALPRHVATPRDVLEERHHIVHPLGPAERDHQDRVEERVGQLGGEAVCRGTEARRGSHGLHASNGVPLTGTTARHGSGTLPARGRAPARRSVDRVSLLSILVPRRCAACGLPGAALCAVCLSGITRLGPTGCERCGAPGPWPVRRCVECSGRRLSFATARAAVSYDAALRPIVAAWKEGGRRDLAVPLAELVAASVPTPRVACLTAVPGDRERGLRRGHAPAEDLAASLGSLWGIERRQLLRRRAVAGSRRQAELPRAQRRANVRGVFDARCPSPPRVCLVDDVYTTGATVAACAAVLRRAGASRVDVVCLARTVR